MRFIGWGLVAAAVVLGVASWGERRGAASGVVERAHVAMAPLAAPRVPSLAVTTEPESAPVHDREPVELALAVSDGAEVGLQGRVLDGVGNVAPGTTVVLRRTIDPDTPREGRGAATDALPKGRILRCTTDAQGRYSFEGLLAGHYRIVVLDLLSQGEIGRPEQIELSGVEEHTIHLPGALELSGMATMASPGRLTLWMLDPPGWSLVAKREVDHSGEFSFRALVPGRYRVRVGGEDHAAESFDFDLYESETSAILRVQAGLVLQGQVYASDARRSAVLSLVSLDDDWGGYARRCDSPAGTFRFCGLGAGRYRLEARDPTQEHGEVPTAQAAFDIELRQDVLDFSRTLVPNEALRLSFDWGDSRRATLGKIALRSADHAEERWQFEFKPDARKRQKFFPPFGEYAGEVAEFVEVPLPPGAWRVEVSAIGYETRITTVDFPGESEVSVPMRQIDGRVVQSRSKAKYHRVEVRSAGSSEAWRPLTSRDRRGGGAGCAIWSVPTFSGAWLDPGNYDLRMLTDSFLPAYRLGVAIENDAEPLVVEIPGEPGRSISGEIRAPNGVRLPTNLTLFQRAGGRWTELPSKGHSLGWSTFEFAGLAPGDYRATLDPAGEYVAAEWTLVDEDLVDQVIVVGG